MKIFQTPARIDMQINRCASPPQFNMAIAPCPVPPAAGLGVDAHPALGAGLTMLKLGLAGFLVSAGAGAWLLTTSDQKAAKVARVSLLVAAATSTFGVGVTALGAAATAASAIKQAMT